MFMFALFALEKVFAAKTHRSKEQYAIRIECPEIVHNIEVLLPQIPCRWANDRMAVRTIAEFEGARLIRVAAHL